MSIMADALCICFGLTIGKASVVLVFAFGFNVLILASLWVGYLLPMNDEL